MGTDLRDRLSSLAELRPAATPPADLWSRGVRRRRATRAVTSLLVVALVVVLGVGGWAWRGSRADLTPAAPHGAPHLPDRVFTPSPWLRGFDGPPGSLVALTTAQRNHFWSRSTPGLVGITASTGTYGFLDLPGAGGPDTWASDDLPTALSPDGRYVAYWVTGTPSSTANTVMLGATVVGVRVYDAVTGEVRTADFPTAHGIDPESLLWTDHRTLVLGFGQIGGADDDGNRSHFVHDYRVDVWPLESARPERLASSAVAGGDSTLSTTGSGDLVASALPPARIVDPRHPGQVLRVRAAAGSGGVLVVSPGLGRVARVNGPGSPEQLQVGLLHPVASGDPRPTVFRRVVPGRYFEPVVWTDAHHLVAFGIGRASGETVGGAYDEIDVRTGQVRTLVTGLLGSGNGGAAAFAFASDLLTAPGSAGTEPSTTNPHHRLAWLLALALVLGAVVWGRRRA